MASIGFPAPTGSAVRAIARGVHRGINLTRQAEDDEYLRRRRALELAGSEQAAAEAGQLRSIVPQIMGAQPQTMEITPGQPAIPATLTPDPAGFEHGAGVMTPGLAARAPVSMSALTLEGLTERLGPEAMSLAVRTPAGQAALKARGVVTREEAAARRRKLQAVEEFKQARTESWEAYKAGDAERGLLRELSACRALADAADDSSKLHLCEQNLRKMYFDLRQDRGTAAAAGRDMARITAAHDRFKQDRSFEAFDEDLMGALASVETDLGRQKAMTILGQIKDRRLDEIKFQPFQEIEAQVSAIMDQSVTTTRPQALQRVLAANPELRAQVLGAMAPKIPQHYAEAMGWGEFPKSRFEKADADARAEGFVPGSREYLGRFTQSLREQAEMERAPQRDREAQELNSTLSSLTRQEASLVREMEGAFSSQDRAAARRELEEVRRDIRSIRQRLRGRIGGTATAVTDEDKRRALARVLRDQYGNRRLRDLSPAERARVAEEVNRRLGLTR